MHYDSQKESSSDLTDIALVLFLLQFCIFNVVYNFECVHHFCTDSSVHACGNTSHAF